MPSRAPAPRSASVRRATRLLVTLLLALPVPVVAQRPAPFSTLRVEVAGLRGLGRGGIHADWTQRDGLALEVATPLPIGEASVGVARLPFRARGGERPDFEATMLALRWGAAARLVGPLALRGSVALGNFHMRFDDGERAVEGLTTESELFVGTRASMELASWHGVGLTAGGSYDRVLTRVAFGVLSARVGAHVTVRTPDWLRGVLE